MRIHDCNTPALVLGCGLGALAIFRSLGQQGIAVFGVGDDSYAPALKSRYCRGFYNLDFNEDVPESFLQQLSGLGQTFYSKPLLIPTTDELAVFVSEFARELQPWFIIPCNDPVLIRSLSSKKAMFQLARQYGLDTPMTWFPCDLNEVEICADEFTYPVLMKGVLGNLLQTEAGFKMVLVHSRQELVERYRQLPASSTQNIMLQEYIPGGDDQVYIFNGYFDEKSKCMAGFTGFKIRQSPIHFGSASLGECRWQAEVAKMTIDFLAKIGYRGIVDIGYRLDPRDGKFKVLDINPRVGQAFRLFVAKNGLDVIRALYLDLTGQNLPECVPIEGRRWLIENNDLVSTWHYYSEGSLNFGSWIMSFKGVQEAAWFRLMDPVPFVVIFWRFFKRTCRWSVKKILKTSNVAESGL